MARITVEDCLEKENNRFALVQLAAKRTKQLLSGSRALTESSNKSVVTALREIADGKVRFMTPEEVEIARQQAAEAELASPPTETTTFVAPTFQDPLSVSDDEGDDDIDDDEVDEELDSDDEADDSDESDDLDDAEDSDDGSDEEKTESEEDVDPDTSRNGDSGK